MKLQEVTVYNLRSQQLLNESWNTLTESQKLYVGRWEKELWPLIETYVKIVEAELTSAQIQQIFQGAEKVAVAGGNNKTVLGKVGSAAGAAAKLPIDIAKQVNAKIDELGRMAQKAGPIQNMDQKFDQLKKDILAKNSDSKIVQGIQKVSNWAKENPGKASLAVGILTTLAAFAGGPAGGAAAGLIFRATKDLLQGEKLSTAVGKSVKTAAYGAIAGWAMRGLGDWLEGLRADVVPYEKAPGLAQIDVNMTRSLSAPGWSLDQSLGTMIVPADQVEQFTALANAARGGDIDSFKELYYFADSFDIKEYVADMNFTNAVMKELALQNDAFLQNLTTANDAIAAIAQGTVSGKMDNKDIKVDGEPLPAEGEENPNVVKSNTESLSMEEKYERYLQEGPLDAIKKGAAAVGSAIKSKAAAVGKELGNKVTVAKLNKQWKAMGEPTDSGSIMNILQDVGMSDDQIAAIGQEANVELKKSASTVDNDTEKTAADNSDATKPNTNVGNNEPSTDVPPQSAPALDIKSLADEIKKAGPNVVNAVKQMLQSEMR